MSAPAGYATAADGVRVAWRDEGPADAPAVLFCTMATAAMSVWDAVAEPLSADWRVIRHDRRGDGDSDPGVEASHTFAGYAQDAALVLDQLDVRAAVVCGMAFGARVALRLALDAPERVTGLALFDATGGPPAPEAERSAGRAEAARLRQAAGLPNIPAERRWFARRDTSGAGLSRNAFQGQPAWLPGLSTIAAPTIVACGEQDPNFAGAQRLAREIPGASFTPMPMCGHGSVLDRPDLILELLAAFLPRAASL